MNRPYSLNDLLGLTPVEFEQLAKLLFQAMGYEVRVTGAAGDQGIDLLLLDAEERSIAQCKRVRGQIGQPAVRDFYGAVNHERARRGYFVTTAMFSMPAQVWASNKNLVLIDGPDLVESVSLAEAGEIHRFLETHRSRQVSSISGSDREHQSTRERSITPVTASLFVEWMRTTMKALAEELEPSVQHIRAMPLSSSDADSIRARLDRYFIVVRQLIESRPHIKTPDRQVDVDWFSDPGKEERLLAEAIEQAINESLISIRGNLQKAIAAFDAKDKERFLSTYDALRTSCIFVDQYVSDGLADIRPRPGENKKDYRRRLEMRRLRIQFRGKEQGMGRWQDVSPKLNR